MERFWWMTATVARRNDPPAEYTVSGVSRAAGVDEVWEEALQAVEEKHKEADRRPVSFRVIVDAFGIMPNREA